MIYAQAYIMMLLGTQLFGDKSVSRKVMQVTGPLGLLQSLIFWRFPSLRPHGFENILWPLASRWGGYLPSSDEKGPRVLQMRHRLDMLQEFDVICVGSYSALEVVDVVDPAILEERHTRVWRSVTMLIYFAAIEWHQVDWVLPQFGGVQSRPPKALDLDYLHSKDGRGEIDGFQANQEFLYWWYGLPHRFLSPEALLGDPREGEVDEVFATRGSQVSPHRTQVPDVPDKRDVDRRRRVGTRMSQQDNGDEDGDGADRVRRAQFKPPDERRPRVRGGGRGGRGEPGQEHEVVDDGYHGEAARGEVCYSDLAPIWAQEDGDGTSSHAAIGTPEFHVNLNEPADDFHDVYFSLGGTPPSAYPDVGPSVSPLEVPQSPVQEPQEDNDDVPLAHRARRVPRRRGCGTGGHI
ncbi:hypothetical protein PIB30_092397 [Stylosanthes scabra]|uniref:Aminotransferase-like plant mobile domain-containing protein n=1 Tax=Stylosanthes scabra TaxID=79078 RepID=A0ABU6QVY2_9FABA|nr:hypothetical protein [Stylosanthes scabra]